MNKHKWKVLSVIVIVLVLFFSCFTGSKSVIVEESEFERHEVVIVGGGIAGLTSAYNLDSKNFVILEKKSTVGGRTISGVHESFTYAKGTEYLGTPEGTLATMIDELGLSPKEIPSPMDAYFDGKNFYYGNDGIKRYLVQNSSPEYYNEFTTLLRDEYKHYDEIPDIKYTTYQEDLDYTTAREWLKDNDIPDVFAKKYNVSSKGLFGANLDDISALSFIPEAAYDYEGGEDIADTDYSDFDSEDLQEEYLDAQNEKSGSYSFVKGITELTDKLASLYKDQIKLNSNVKSITEQDDEYLITYTNAEGKEVKMIAEEIILSVPATEALKIAPDVLSREQKDIMNKVEYSSYATVALFSDTPIFDKAFDLAVPDDYYFTDIYDSTWVERNYDENKEEIDKYIISIYVAPKESNDHKLDVITDEELLKNVYKDLDKVFDSASNKVTGYDIERFPYAYPVMSLGAYERLLRLNELNTGSLILAGDYMVYPTFEAAVQSGYVAAEKLNDN